ncbi:MAG: hypothetical protein ABIJ04_08305 [Bacteroidota bacterium]
MKKKIRRIFNLILGSLLFTGTLVLLGFAENEQKGTICRSLRINLHYGEADSLVTEAEIDSLIRSVAGEVKGKPMVQINTEKLERVVRGYPYMANVQVYGTHTGEIYVNAFQREPVIRIITETNQGYYIGRTGVLLPCHSDYPVRVLVASGAIPDSASSSPLLSDLLKLALFINHDPFLKAQVDQIFVNGPGDYELIPKVGDHVILLGDAEALGDKFRCLMVFYRQGLNQIGWNKYNVINIKYKNQVVCSKL